MEEWRPIEGFNGRYEVSSLGNVRNARTKNVLSQRTHDGYKRINLYMNSADEKGATKAVHRLVAEAFLPNPMGFG